MSLDYFKKYIKYHEPVFTKSVIEGYNIFCNVQSCAECVLDKSCDFGLKILLTDAELEIVKTKYPEYFI